MKAGMGKKPTQKKTRVSGKNKQIKKATVPQVPDKAEGLKEGSASDLGLQETASENPVEEKNRETSVSDSSATSPVAVDARETVKLPEGASPEADEVLELLAFRLADEEYAVDILMIKEIIRPMEITRVPRRAAFIRGIISLRGTVIPIFDLRTRLGLTESVSNRSTRILVVGLEKGLVGVIADSVTEVVKVRMQDIEPPPAVGGGSSSGHLKGVTRVNGRLLILLDLEKAITLEW